MIARNDFLSIYGLYLYDPTLFDLMVVPTGVDKDTLVDNLVMECAELEVLYPDAKFMRLALGAWSKKQLPAWDKLYKTTQFEYNPIWNKDGKIVEEHDETRKVDVTQNRTGSNSGSSSDEGTNQASAFNEAGFHNTEHSTDEGRTSGAYEEQNKGKNNETIHHKNTRTETGNIGVTTTQQMIREEREVDEFVIDDYIIADFKKRFCLLVY